MGGLSNKDPSTWGTTLGSPIFGNPQLSYHSKETMFVYCRPRFWQLKITSFNKSPGVVREGLITE